MGAIAKSNIKIEYEKQVPKYNKLGASICHAIEMLLEEHSIQYLKVYYRVKESSSFLGKIDRYTYKNPLEEMLDMCGVRIICYYNSDIDKICELIKNEFYVFSSQDKETLLNPDQFGYRSHHLIVKIMDSWLVTPNYRGLDNLKAEIQIRTNLMHTWAEIEHKLGYKKEEDIPKNFRRKFSLLSAKLEEADYQFEELKQQITTYREERQRSYITSDENELNLDILQAFLDDIFPDRKRSKEHTSSLLTDFNKFNISIPQFIKLYEQCKHLLEDLQKDENILFGNTTVWSQVGVARAVLELTVENFYKNYFRPDKLEDLLMSYRKKLI